MKIYSTVVFALTLIFLMTGCENSIERKELANNETTYLLLNEISSQYFELYSCPVDTILDLDTALLKLSVKECRGELSFTLTDKQGVKKMTGQYINGLDTLKKYTIGTSAITGERSRSILKYFQPIPSGKWLSFEKNGKADTVKFVNGFKVEE
jgi:hypothetical protein